MYLTYITSSTMSEHYPPGDTRHSFIIIALHVTSVVDNLFSGFELWTSHLHLVICVTVVRSVMRVDHSALNMRVLSTRLPLSSVEHPVVVKKITLFLYWERFMYLCIYSWFMYRQCQWLILLECDVNCGIISEWWIGKDVEGSYLGLVWGFTSAFPYKVFRKLQISQLGYSFSQQGFQPNTFQI